MNANIEEKQYENNNYYKKFVDHHVHPTLHVFIDIEQVNSAAAINVSALLPCSMC